MTRSNQSGENQDLMQKLQSYNFEARVVLMITELAMMVFLWLLQKETQTLQAECPEIRQKFSYYIKRDRNFLLEKLTGMYEDEAIFHNPVSQGSGFYLSQQGSEAPSFIFKIWLYFIYGCQKKEKAILLF